MLRLPYEENINDIYKQNKTYMIEPYLSTQIQVAWFKQTNQHILFLQHGTGRRSLILILGFKLFKH